MGLGLSRKRKTKSAKVIHKFVKQRVKEKKILNDQVERLDSQLQNDSIDQHTYERLRDLLEINFVKQRDTALEKAFQKI